MCSQSGGERWRTLRGARECPAFGARLRTQLIAAPTVSCPYGVARPGTAKVNRRPAATRALGAWTRYLRGPRPAASDHAQRSIPSGSVASPQVDLALVLAIPRPG